MRLTQADLLEVLSVEQVDQHVYHGMTRDLGWGRVYGGMVLAQALAAAESSVPVDRLCHSLHAYFLRPGRLNIAVHYEVDPIRDGRSFTTRRVVAHQDGKAIFELSASFQRDEEGLEHQDPPPNAPPPDTLFSEPPRADRAILICPVSPRDPHNPQVKPPHHQVWYRAAHGLSDDSRLHRRILAFSSDSHFLTTAMQPHGVSWMTQGMQIASLDHSMWFHRDFSASQWLLYDVHSPSASGARGLVRGAFYTQEGLMVASTMQEGLMRDRRGS